MLLSVGDKLGHTIGAPIGAGGMRSARCSRDITRPQPDLGIPSATVGARVGPACSPGGFANLGLVTIEGSCSLANSGLKPEDFDNIPNLALKGDYTATSEVCQTTVDQINARRAAGHGTAKAEYIKLDELKDPVFKGTTHMMMIGTNNLNVADVIPNWTNENILLRKANGKQKK